MASLGRRMQSVVKVETGTALHGQKLPITLDTDPDYQYTGRCELNTEKTNEVLAQIVISCTCDPYKTKADGTGGVL